MARYMGQVHMYICMWQRPLGSICTLSYSHYYCHYEQEGKDGHLSLRKEGMTASLVGGGFQPLLKREVRSPLP